MRTKLTLLFLLLIQVNCVFSYISTSSKKLLRIIETPKEIHLVPIYAADTRAHRLGIQRNLNASEFIGSMGGQFPVYNLNRGKHRFQFEIAGSTYMGLLRSVNHGSVLNTDFYVDVFLNYQFRNNWALRLGSGHTSQHLSDDAIANAQYPFTNYARDYHQVGISYKGKRNAYHLYNNVIINYNFKTDEVHSGKITIQPGFELNINQTFLNQTNPGGFIIGADFKFRGELDFRSTNNLLLAYQFNHLHPQKLRLVLNFSSGADERGQFYRSNRNLISTGIYAEF
jgi:hypothetical protein